MDPLALDDLWPVVVLQDRYTGCYSRGAWVAFTDTTIDGVSPSSERLRLVLDGVYGDDSDAADFWHEHRDADWIAAGQTPNEAVEALAAKQAQHP